MPLALLLSRSNSARRQRRRRQFWKRPGRAQGWWQEFDNGTILPEEWKKSFRMQKINFERLCAELKPFLQREETNMRMPISVECQVATTQYYLSDEGRVQKTANAIEISRSSVSFIIHRVTKAISVHHGPQYIQLPFTEEAV